MVRRLLVALTSLATVTCLGFAVAPAASAAPQGGYGCAGNQVGAHNIKNTDGSTWGTIYVYYSSANGGTNCAVNVAKKYAGQRHLLEVRISQGNRAEKQSGYFYEYAGPVSLTNTDGKCITLAGWVTSPSGNAVGDQWTDVHCG
ncbi:hypothetical protein OHB33_40635 (plasmid) [Streptomyces sp. NBC_01558]|uniref:hypothetical protein n=1 Tax=Streptomyces sp. NBC_01558 TaxID=2975878 RepID=UPI002DD9AF43|nr:hypothetical protein [Streptomyces sp. NBC_01558]WSD82698.1 hypothetical protein OHB33_40635 [Streptomyces sp. NBC_01558]